MLFKKNINKFILFVCLIGSVSGFVWWNNYNSKKGSYAKFDIRPFDFARDAHFIKQQNYDNWYLLHASKEYDLDFMLEKNSPYIWEPRTYGKLKTVVLFDNNIPVGFVNYYMRGLYEGTVFLLDVDENYRGRGFGEVLFGYAVEGLKKEGAKIIKVSVRAENERAQKLYRKFGFKIESADDGFCFYRLDI